MQSPIQSTSIVRYAQHDWVWIVVNLAICELDDRRTVVNDDCHILQTVNRDEGFVFIVFEVQ